MLDAITLYFIYWSSCIISLRIVTTDLDLLSYASRKDNTDSDLIKNVVLLWNNVVFCAIFNQQRDLSVWDADYESSASYACQKSWIISSTSTEQ